MVKISGFNGKYGKWQLICQKHMNVGAKLEQNHDSF